MNQHIRRVASLDGYKDAGWCRDNEHRIRIRVFILVDAAAGQFW